MKICSSAGIYNNIELRTKTKDGEEVRQGALDRIGMSVVELYAGVHKEKFQLFGREQDTTIFISDNDECRGGIEIKLYNERDYYKVGAWLVLALGYLNSVQKDRIIRSYWPNCFDDYKPLL